jgi:E3 ubiquitin-protein ligase Mdm2
MYASKTKCSKCNLDRQGNIILSKKNNNNQNKNTPTNNNQNDENHDENKNCAVCWVQTKNTILIHENGKDAHQCCCYVCANKIFKTTKKCPMCNQMIKQIIQVYN